MSDSKFGKKELTMEQRLLLAFGLMGVVLLVSSYLMPKPATETKAPPRPAAKAAAPAEPAPSPPAPAAPASRKTAPRGRAAAPPTPTRILAEREETFQIESRFYKIVFSNRGAVVRSWVLKLFRDSTGRPLELANVRGLDKVGGVFSFRFHENQSADAVNQALYVARVSEDKLTIEFEYSDPPWSARKKFAFQEGSYLVKVASEVRNSGVPKPHLLAWRGGFGDETVIGAAVAQHTVRFDLATNKLETLAAKDATQAHRGRFSFAGINDAYFAAVALPDTGRDFEIHTLADPLPNAIDNKEEPHAGVAVGGDPANDFQLFVGPKDTDLMKSISPRLTQLIDFGWFFFIAEPLFRSLQWLNHKWIHNYGWSIVVITVIINFLLLPLKISSLKSMKKMSVLQPQIAAINEKYRGLSLKDPRKQQQNQEVMALYKKHGVNPMGGCVPMILQIPFFIAFYKVLSVAIELRGAPWLWVTDLSRPETLPIRILPVAMIVTQFIMQKMTPSTTADPAQQRIMLLMPLFLGFMFYGVSAGLVLYWLTGNVVGIAQQWFFNRWFPAKAPAASPAGKKRDSKK